MADINIKTEDLFSNASRSTNHCLPFGMLNVKNIVTVRKKKIHMQFCLRNNETDTRTQIEKM